MLRNLRKLPINNKYFSLYIQKNTFLTNDYKCSESWNSQTSSPTLTKVNLNDFYSVLEQNYTSKGVISAVDVDIFANAMKDQVYVDELKDLLHKLRMSADTGNTLESTLHAATRNFIEFGLYEELVEVLKDPLNYGLFLDEYTANILLDKLIVSEKYDLAANVAALVMLQEEYSNDITCSLCQYACYKHILTPRPPKEEPAAPVKGKKVEEIKIRVRYLRNDYFDDHFDIKDPWLLSGKTLAWLSEKGNDNLNNNLQVMGWLLYQKFDKLKELCENLSKSSNTKVFPEVIQIMKSEGDLLEAESKEVVDKCLALLGKVGTTEASLEEALKINIENAINKVQNNDIAKQKQLYQSWVKIREAKLEEQIKRLDRAKRMQMIEERQKELNQQEQKLWFFENEESIDLQIEEKEKNAETPMRHKSTTSKVDEDYIPPEILPKRK